MTGMVQALARSTTVLWSMTRAMTMSTRPESTLPVSPIVSCPPSWIMPGPRYWACPPIWVIAVSKETRVRVEDCWNIMPSVMSFISGGL